MNNSSRDTILVEGKQIIRKACDHFDKIANKAEALLATRDKIDAELITLTATLNAAAVERNVLELEELLPKLNHLVDRRKNIGGEYRDLLNSGGKSALLSISEVGNACLSALDDIAKGIPAGEQERSFAQRALRGGY